MWNRGEYFRVVGILEIVEKSARFASLLLIYRHHWSRCYETMYRALCACPRMSVTELNGSGLAFRANCIEKIMSLSDFTAKHIELNINLVLD